MHSILWLIDGIERRIKELSVKAPGKAHCYW